MTFDPRYRSLGIAYLCLCAAFALHIFDEATTGFLDVYNPTVIAMRAKLGWWPMPTFGYREWLWGLIGACVITFALSVEVFRGARWMRIPAAVFAVIMLLNACAHTLATIFGRTAASVTFPRPAPGFWSSPLMFAASVYVLIELRRTRVRGYGDGREREKKVSA